MECPSQTKIHGKPETCKLAGPPCALLAGDNGAVIECHSRTFSSRKHVVNCISCVCRQRRNCERPAKMYLNPFRMRSIRPSTFVEALLEDLQTFMVHRRPLTWNQGHLSIAGLLEVYKRLLPARKKVRRSLMASVCT
jgi:hypothetical protein